MKKTFRYRILVEWSPEDETFVARVPALQYLAAHGDTPEEAAHEARVAAEGMLKSYAARGRRVPESESATDFSGQVRLRMPKSLHERLVQLATFEAVSLNTLMVSFLSEAAGFQWQRPTDPSGAMIVREDRVRYGIGAENASRMAPKGSKK